MDEPRLKAKLRVQAMLREAQTRGSFGAVLQSGDIDAGGILVVLRGRAGLIVLAEQRVASGDRAWTRVTGPTAVDQDAVDTYLARQRGYDPDLWVVEFESADLTLPFAGEMAAAS